jgi:hypothetical protein
MLVELAESLSVVVAQAAEASFHAGEEARV